MAMAGHEVVFMNISHHSSMHRLVQTNTRSCGPENTTSMFGAFRLNEITRDLEHVDLVPGSGQDARGYTLMACDPCRARKLRCSGNRDGCDRCRASSTDCTYAVTDTGTGRRRPRRISTTAAGTSSGRASRLTLRTTASPVQSRINSDRGDLFGGPYASPPRTAGANSDVDISLQQQQEHDRSVDNIAAADTSVHSWDNAAWDEPLFGPDQQLLGGSLYDYLSMSEPFTPHRYPVERVSVSSASSNRWPETSQQPLAQNTAAPAVQRVLTQAAKESSISQQGCGCLESLVKVLENVGKSQTQAEWTGIDMQLMSLWQAICSCQKVVACDTCSTCSDNPVLVATIIQLFAGISDDLGSLCSKPRNGPQTDASNKEEEISMGAVWIGRYRLENIAMGLPLVREVVVMHLTEMRCLLKKLRERLGSRQGVRQQATEAEQKAGEICNKIRAGMRAEV